MNNSISIIGGGIAGCQTAIILAKMGYPITLIDENAYYGGHARSLGKFFPTDDCSLCIAATKPQVDSGGFRKCMYRSELSSFPNLALYSNTKVIQVQKNKTDFSLNLLQEAQYVDPALCIGCRACEKVCPETADPLPSGYLRKAIYHDPSTLPSSFSIEQDVCTKCGECVKACPTNAIQLDAELKELTLTSDLIIYATGFREFEDLPISLIPEKTSQIITHTDLSELLNSSRILGTPLMTSDQKPIKSVIMTLCTGSRSVRVAPYCSGICCTYALKNAILLREMDIEVTICYMDIRTFGENERYYDKARALGVKFIRGNPIQVSTLENTTSIIVEDTLSSESMLITSDLIVITPPLVPNMDNESILVKKIPLDMGVGEHKFIKNSIGRTRPKELQGIYRIGTTSKPMDIPELVSELNDTIIQILSDYPLNKDGGISR